MLMIEDGRGDDAEALLAEGLVAAPARIELAVGYAQLLVERGALVSALQTLERFTDNPSADAAALALQAGILDRLNRYSESADAYKRALRQQPRQAVWWTGLGVTLEHQGQPVTALEAYRRAAQLPLPEAIETFVQQRIQALDGAGNHAQG
jgi:tetratricopeptide (TPR) repeat protein